MRAIARAPLPPRTQLGKAQFRPDNISVSTALLIVLFVTVFLQGAVSERVLGVSYDTQGTPDSPIARLLVEIAVAVNFGWLVLHRTLRAPPGCAWFLAYGGWAILSGVVTGAGVIEALMFARYTLYAFAVYCVAWNGDFSPRQERNITIALAVLFTLQVLASVYKVTAMQDRTEWRVGTMSVGGGELATIFPLFALAYVMGYYFFVRPSFWVLFVGLAFGIVGYASGKRAIYFTVPAFVAANAGLYVFVVRRHVGLIKVTFPVHMLACAVITMPLALYGLESSQGIGVGSSGSDAKQAITYAFDFARGYEAGITGDGRVTGRASANTRVLTGLTASTPTYALFGWGPTALIRKGGHTLYGTDFAPLGIAYGIVGWSRDVISIGLPGAVFCILAYAAALRRTYRSVRMKAPKGEHGALAFGTLSGFCVVFYSYFAYGSAAMTSGAITFPLLFASAVVIRESHASRPQHLVCQRPIGPAVC